MSLGAVNAFIVRAVIPRRSLCCRTMPKSPSFRRRSSQTKTFSGVRSRRSVRPGGALRPELQPPVVADEDVQRRGVAVERLPAVQLAEGLEDARDLAARRGF